MMPNFQLRLLGSFQLLRQEEAVSSFRSEKERALLVYLAMEALRPHPRSSLAGLFWPELPEHTAHNNLRVTLHRLRQVLGDQHSDHPLLEISRDAIQLSQSGKLWIDVWEFQELFDRTDRHLHEKLVTCQECMAWYVQAVALYRGDFLQGIYPAESLPFSEWALLKREHLHRQALRALYFLAGYQQRRGELDLALGFARRQLELEPWREEAHVQVMTILALRGERSAAMHQYECCRQVLMEELGVEPADETRALYERILASRKRRRHNLPLQITPFVGRKLELNQVNEYLSNPDCRLLTILGPGGIGKSRLACQAAEAQIYSYLQGVFLVSLAGVTRQEDMLRAIAAALDLKFRSAGDLKAQLLNYLREKDMLLVLDNFEQLLGQGKSSVIRVLDEMLENAPGLRLLVTSRQRLDIKQEWLFVLQGLSFPANALDEGSQEFDAVQLFLQSAQRTNSSFQPIIEVDKSVLYICQMLEGVPLAIELAATWTRMISTEQIAQEIESNLDFLASSYPDLPERHRSLRATFEHSYNLLTAEEQQVLCRLSLFPVSFDRIAAEQIAGATLIILTSLYDRSFLEPVRNKDHKFPPRYRMHELIRQFSIEKLKQDQKEVNWTKDHYRHFYMRFLNDRNKMVMGGTAPHQAVQEVNGEIEHVRLALEQSIEEGNLNELGNSLNILMFFYEIQGLFDEAERVFGKISRRMEDAALDVNPNVEKAANLVGRSVAYHGWYCMHLARFDQAFDLYQKGLVLSHKAGDLEGYGSILNALGVLASGREKYPHAKSYLQRALKVCSENGYIWLQAGIFLNLGYIALTEGDLPLAIDLFKKSFPLYTSLNDDWGIAGCLESLGDIALQQRDFELAERYFRQTIEIRRNLNQPWRVALAMKRLGEVAYHRKQYDGAKKYHEESLAILYDFGERTHLASTLARYGEICTILGEYDQARESLITSIRLAHEIGLVGTTVRALSGLASLLEKEGKRERSFEILVAIYEHPSLEHEAKKSTARLLFEIQETIPPKVVQTALENRKVDALENLVRDILRSDR